MQILELVLVLCHLLLRVDRLPLPLISCTRHSQLYRSECLHFLRLLRSVLFSLTVTATHALGAMSLVTKCSPWTKILAPLAPFDLHSRTDHHPNINITKSAKAFVLGWDDCESIILIRVSRPAASRTRARLAAHHTTTHIGSVGTIPGVLVPRQMCWEVNQTGKFRYGGIFHSLHVAILRSKN